MPRRPAASGLGQNPAVADAVSTGDFERVARELSGPLRSYLTRQVGNPDVAEELLQETLIRIDRGLPGFEGRSGLKTWAFAIATRVVVDHLRAPENRLRVVEVDETVEPPDGEAGLDDRLIASEMNACVRGVIDTLPADYRAALVLHDLEGMTAEQTAAIVGCSLPTAKIRIHRARQRLRKALEDECHFYRDDGNVFRCTPG
jgi:RNA polymerase sigma-70 factor (ECF subfamily)